MARHYSRPLLDTLAVAATLHVAAATSLSAQLRQPELLDIGGYALETLILGEGSPTVVFEAGFSGGIPGWRPLQDSVAVRTRTLAYERAGLGKSEVGPEPRSALQIARELRALLSTAGVRGPVILVGHSAGGMFIRSYAAEYPDDVAGMVFVDPATEDIYANMRRQAPARWDMFVEEVNSPSPGWGPQWRALPRSLEEVRQAWPLPEGPKVVLTGLQLLPGEWALETPEYMEYWLESHTRLVDRLGDAEHIILDDVDHLTILQHPALRGSILRMVETVRVNQNAP